MLQEAITRPGTIIRHIDGRRSSPSRSMQISRYRHSSGHLFFSRAAKALRNAFRTYALRTIHSVAREELGSSLESALVSTWSQPGEPDSTILLLSITAILPRKDDREKLRQVRKAILAKIAEEASSWSDEQKKDYSEKIYFELTPVDV